MHAHSIIPRIFASVIANLAPLLAQVTTLRHRHEDAELNRLIATNPDIAVLGRYLATQDPRDIGRFKTPTLRNVSRTAPYLHDGSVGSLAEAISLELYGRSSSSYPIVLTQNEQADLLAFLESLDSPLQ